MRNHATARQAASCSLALVLRPWTSSQASQPVSVPAHAVAIAAADCAASRMLAFRELDSGLYASHET